jgi:hypothetical protein
VASSVTGFLVKVSVAEMGGFRVVKKVISFVGSSSSSEAGRALSMNGSRRLNGIELVESAHSVRELIHSSVVHLILAGGVKDKKNRVKKKAVFT